MKKEKEDIEDSEDGDDERAAFAFRILNYKVYGTKRQYSVFKVNKNSKGQQKETRLGFYSWLEHVLSAIRQDGSRLSITDSKTLDVAINRIVKFNEEFNKLIEPLRKLENL